MTKSNQGDPATQAGLSSLRDEAASASSPKASIPVAATQYERAVIWLRAFKLARGFHRSDDKGNPLPNTIHGVMDMADEIGAWALDEWDAYAQAIEARRAETQGGSVADESAVGNADAPKE